jgi:hypothetical protein
VCGQCKRDLPAAEFHRSKSYNDGLYGKCKACCATALSKRKAGQGSGSRRLGSGLSGSASRDLSAAVKSALDELVKVAAVPIPAGPVLLAVCDF